MKTYILTLLTLFCFSLTSVSAATPGNEMPEVVNSSMKAKFGSFELKDWRVEDRVCLVTFEMQNKMYEAAFDKDGNWIRTGLVIKENQLPREVEDAFKSSTYASWKVNKVSEVEFNGFDGVKMYELEVRKSDDEYSLFYNAAGELVMKVHQMQLRVQN